MGNHKGLCLLWVVNQFVVKENDQTKRLDVIVFVNGLLCWAIDA